jgi:glycine cleavage system H protein
MDVVDDLLYTKEHEWISIEGDEAIIGISDYAQEALGDITYVQLPNIDEEVEQFEEFASVESVKAANDIFSPMSGRVISVNDDLNEEPGLINSSPYDKGWIARIKLSDTEEQSNLMSAEEYRKFLEGMG